MKLTSLANEAYFNGQWSLFQWPMKPITMTNEACFNSKRSFFAIYHGPNREGWSRNREGCVMDKSPFSSIYHAEYSLYTNTLKAFFRKIVMGDRWFAKNIFIRRSKNNLLHISYQLLSSIRQEKRDIDKSIILLEIKHGISDAQTGRILPVILYQTAPGNTCSWLHLHRNHIQPTLNDELYFRRISWRPIMRATDAISHQTLKNIVLSQSTLIFLKDWIDIQGKFVFYSAGTIEILWRFKHLQDLQSWCGLVASSCRVESWGILEW